MLSLNRVIIILLYQLVVLGVHVLPQEILGCGGFIRSHNINIDYSKVQIKLLTKSGSLKDHTECAPNNGYYFLPLYDKGEYVLKVDPPNGWSFEPTEVEVGGANDVCSQGKDINFTFKGFGITGNVTSYKANDGPAGVTVTLHSNNQLLSTTTTSSLGTFSFTPIQPGKYLLTVTHPNWIFLKDKIEVTVKEGNTELPINSLVIFGYDVRGKVTNEDESSGVSGVSFILFGTGEVKNCEKKPIKEFENQKPLCHVFSDDNGQFVFPGVTNGEYKLIPYYPGVETTFDVDPQQLQFQILHNSIQLPQTFKVTGFTIRGVIQMPNGAPLPHAKLFLSGKQIAVTDIKGQYSIDKMKTGQYTLKIIVDDVQFDEKVVKISPTAPSLPQLKPSAYRVCGSITLATKGSFEHRNIVIQNSAGSLKQEIKVDPKKGKYCLYLPPDKYEFSVAVSDDDKSAGLQFFPLRQAVHVIDVPLNDVNFLQLKARVEGKVECFKDSDCDKVSITLRVTDGRTVKTVHVKDNSYKFTEILPGNYEVVINADIYCWDRPNSEISITSEYVQVPSFKQTGFSVNFISFHDSAVEFYDPAKAKKVAVPIPAGRASHCVSSPGEYKFIPKSCHVYPNESYTWDTKNLSPVTLSTNIHRHRGKILSNVAADGIKVKIESGGDFMVVGPLKSVKDTSDFYIYTFDFNAQTDVTYVITPLSDIFLFSPPSLKVIGSYDCNYDVAKFNGELGKIISGKVSPPLIGVVIQIFGKDKNTPVHTVVTQSDGLYRIGPLNSAIDYTVTAELSGFAITGPDDSGNFFAHKLAEIVVDVTALTNGKEMPLQGVLLSLSGGQGYRKNSITSEKGSLVFNSLSPGEYYLRPMMKEYRFEPPSRIINVTEGTKLQVKLSGNRVAFSAFGMVTSLNGEPESGSIIEAQGQGNCSKFQEEATTEETGNFRIRGLRPTCTYHIGLKADLVANSHIHRISPEFIAVQITKDVTNLKFVAFHPILRNDVSVLVHSSVPEHYRTLKLKLCREDEPDLPIYTSKIDAHFTNKFNSYNNNPGLLFHLPSVQLNGKKYFLQLDSSLSESLYKYKSNLAYFEANSSFKALTLTFNAERKADHNEMSQTSIFVLPLIVLIGFILINRDKLLNYITNTFEQPRFISLLSPRTTPLQTHVTDTRADDIIVEQIMNINKRKMKPRKT